MEASGARGGSVRRPGARWLFCRKVLRFATNRETVRRIPMVQLLRSYIFHKSPQTKNYFYTKKRRLSIYKQTPRHFANAPSHHPRPHLIPPPRSTRNPNLSCLPRRSLSPPALPSLVSLPPPSSHHLYCGVAAVAGAGTSALLILLHRGHHLLDGASAGGGADAG
jgi:hypothetical protein